MEEISLTFVIFVVGMGFGMFIASKHNASSHFFQIEKRRNKQSFFQERYNFLLQKSNRLLSQLQSIIGISEILRKSNLNSPDKRNIESIYNSAIEQHQLLSELFCLHKNDIHEITGSAHAHAKKSFKNRVLVVDDEEEFTKILSQSLTRLNIECDMVNNGEDAVFAVRQHDYAVVLMDDQMPIKNGIEATHEIRGFEGHKKHTFIVATTAQACRGDLDRCFAAGVDAYLSKPFTFDELKCTLERFVDLSKMTQAS